MCATGRSKTLQMSHTIKQYTLAILKDADRVLLGMKKRGFGVGKWNGFGGKVEQDETITAAAHRELREESGMVCSDLKQIGLIHFEFENGPVLMEVHLFTGSSFSGTPTECDEMKPAWFNLADVPFNEMWKDDEHWWPYLMKNLRFYGYFRFRGTEIMLHKYLRPLDENENFNSLTNHPSPDC